MAIPNKRMEFNAALGQVPQLSAEVLENPESHDWHMFPLYPSEQRPYKEKTPSELASPPEQAAEFGQVQNLLESGSDRQYPDLGTMFIPP